MSEGHIHPTAIVETGANIGDGVIIEPYAIVKSGVTLQDRVVVKSHAYIDGNTTIGEDTVIYPSTCIGTDPQHLRYEGQHTQVIIGKKCIIREFVTINSSYDEGSAVTVGDNCFIMAYSHIAHNCSVGNHVIMSNNATLGGHVTIEDHVVVGGMTPIHQFVRVGCYAMVGGMSRVIHDIPPYTIGAGVPYKFGGLNLIGLKRHGFSLQTRKMLSRVFRFLHRSGLRFSEALNKIEEEVEMIPEVQHWVDFCRQSTRGITGVQGMVHNSEETTTSSDKAAESNIEAQEPCLAN